MLASLGRLTPMLRAAGGAGEEARALWPAGMLSEPPPARPCHGHRAGAVSGQALPKLVLLCVPLPARPLPSDRLRDRLPLTTELLGTLLREMRWGGARPGDSGMLPSGSSA